MEQLEKLLRFMIENPGSRLNIEFRKNSENADIMAIIFEDPSGKISSLISQRMFSNFELDNNYTKNLLSCIFFEKISEITHSVREETHSRKICSKHLCPISKKTGRHLDNDLAIYLEYIEEIGGSRERF